MNDFNYYAPTKVVFGKGAEQKVGNLIKEQNCKKVLIHYGSGSARRSGLLDRIEAIFDKEGITYVELGGVVPNPRLSLVYEGIALCKKENVDFILAVGGGSVIDSAKAIGYGVANEGDVWDFFDFKRKPTACLPIGVVLTIAAAGSEMSGSCVITKEDGGMHDRLQPIKVCCFRSGAYDDASTISDSMRMHGYPDAYDGTLFQPR